MRSISTVNVFSTIVACLHAIGCVNALAAGGTSVVATKGQPAHVAATWPEGTGVLVNDASRTSGWNSWFTEWPNDVNQYAFQIKSTEDLNRLIAKLAAVKSELRQIRLSHMKEPASLGWVSRLPEGNNVPVVFSIGDQSRIDQWYQRVRKPFGAMEFTAAPVAVPPTLTIFVQNQLIKLDELEIPKEVDVTVGYVPTVFYKSNTKQEAQKAKEVKARESKVAGQNIDEKDAAAMAKIEAFLESRGKAKAGK